MLCTFVGVGQMCPFHNKCIMRKGDANIYEYRLVVSSAMSRTLRRAPETSGNLRESPARSARCDILRIPSVSFAARLVWLSTVFIERRFCYCHVISQGRQFLIFVLVKSTKLYTHIQLKWSFKSQIDANSATNRVL